MEDLLGNKLDPIKPALSHIGLYISIVAYTAIGAKVRCFSFYQAQYYTASITQPSLSVMGVPANSENYEMVIRHLWRKGASRKDIRFLSR